MDLLVGLVVALHLQLRERVALVVLRETVVLVVADMLEA
jgi:hypothetical protein